MKDSARGAKEHIKDAKKEAKASIQGKVAAKADAFLEKNVMKVLGNAGEMVKEGAKAPGMPAFMTNYIDSAHEFLWDDVERELCEGIMLKYGVADNEYKQTSLSFWNSNRPTFWPKGETFPWVWRWARARFLHATQPADTTLYQNLREAVPLFLTLVSLYPATSVPLFLVTLIFINKTDEFQLVNYILKFKGAQFISAGIIPAAQTGMKLFFSCFKNVAVHDLYSQYLPPEMCVADAPGVKKAHLLILEPIRLVLLYIAAYLLYYQGGYGGIEEIKALEAARTDAADGCLDGEVDKKALKKMSKEARGQVTQHAHPARASSPVAGSEHGHSPASEINEITFEAKNHAIGQARIRAGAELAHGFMLPSFLFYDACVVAFLTLCFGAALFTVDEPPWMLWTCAYYFRLIYSILSFPFLVFLIPIVGPSLHHAKPTAYDKQGMLVPKLTTAQIKLMIAKMEKDKAMRDGPKQKDVVIKGIKETKEKAEKKAKEAVEKTKEAGEKAKRASMQSGLKRQGTNNIGVPSTAPPSSGRADMV
jgi:hypothetical protein